MTLRIAVSLVLVLACAIIAAADTEPRMDAANLLPNGGFERLLDAAARPLPADWSDYRPGPTSTVEASKDAFEGEWSLRLAARGADVAGANSQVIAAARGIARLHYKILASAAAGANLALYAIGVSGPQAAHRPAGGEVTRQGFVPPKEHVGDGQWHEASLEFDFTARGADYCIIAPRVNEATAATGDGDWLLDAIEVRVLRVGPQIKLAHLWCDNPLARAGDLIHFSAWVENAGDEDAADVALRLSSSGAIEGGDPVPGRAGSRGDSVKPIGALPPGSYERVDWVLKAAKPGAAVIEVAVATANGASLARASYKILVLGKAAAHNRQELVTDAAGYWRLLDKPSALQQGNAAPLAPLHHKRSAGIKHNPYGICIHLPRARDYEAPFAPAHLIDDDPETCWSSQQNPSAYPGRPPWAEVDLGCAAVISAVSLIPYWRNSDLPIGFSISASLDRRRWDLTLRVKDHHFVAAGPPRGDKIAQVFALPAPVRARFVRIAFERLPLAGGNYAEVSQGYKARLSGIEVLDEGGRNLALSGRGARVTVSDVFTGWQDSAEAIARAFPRVFDLGVKWVRVGQWGDQTEWAAVEREKGKFAVDPATDTAINDLARSGVDILWGLNYGNALYDRPQQPLIDMGPIYREGHPFYLNWGPRTAAGRRAFVRYVDYVVRRYKDRVKFWELWNEENGWYPFHEPELYGKLLLAVSRRIKTIDSKATVVFGGTAAPAPITTEIALREGAAPYVDAYAFHPYGIDKPEGGMGTMEFYRDENLSQSREQTGWNRLEDIVAGVRKPFAQHGKPEVAVWLNEWGTNVAGLDYSYNPGIGEYGCAKYLMRFYIYSAWLGLRTAWWALYTDNRSQDWGVFTPGDCGWRPMSYALQNVCSVVSDVEPLRDLDYAYDGPAPDPRVIAFKRDRDREMLTLVWAAELNGEQVKGYPSKLSFALKVRPSQVTLTDLYWGVTQPARWSYDNGRVTLDRLIVRDYPVVISCRE
jgi:hypothetical protein